MFLKFSARTPFVIPVVVFDSLVYLVWPSRVVGGSLRSDLLLAMRSLECIWDLFLCQIHDQMFKVLFFKASRHVNGPDGRRDGGNLHWIEGGTKVHWRRR